MQEPSYYIGMVVGAVLVLAVEMFVFCILMMAVEEDEMEKEREHGKKS